MYKNYTILLALCFAFLTGCSKSVQDQIQESVWLMESDYDGMKSYRKYDGANVHNCTIFKSGNENTGWKKNNSYSIKDNIVSAYYKNESKPTILEFKIIESGNDKKLITIPINWDKSKGKKVQQVFNKVDNDGGCSKTQQNRLEELVWVKEEKRNSYIETIKFSGGKLNFCLHHYETGKAERSSNNVTYTVDKNKMTLTKNDGSNKKQTVSFKITGDGVHSILNLFGDKMPVYKGDVCI